MHFSLLTTSLALLVGWTAPSQAMQPCPPRAEMREKAKIIVEARLKSLFIGESGLLSDEAYPTRIARAELEIVRVIKGKLSQKEVVVFGFTYPSGPIKELSMMATLYGFGEDTFEWELSRVRIDDTTEFYSLSSCVYYKFPDLVEAISGTHDNPVRSKPAELLPHQ